MADYSAPSPKVTTGPIRGSRKVHIGPLNVAMRAIHLEPSCGEAPLNVYDTSGPYTDPAVQIDIAKGLSELRASWIRGRGDVEEVAQREVRPEDNGQLGPDIRKGFVVGGIVGYSRIFKPFADSPLVATRGSANQFYATLGVGYTF